MNPFIRLLGMKNSTDKNSNYYFINISLTFAPRIPAKNKMKKKYLKATVICSCPSLMSDF